MRFLKRITDKFTAPAVDPNDGDPAYRCLQCGADFERNHRSCPDCGGAFIASLEAEE